MTLPIGLGIGRLVFRALNRVETVLALGLITAVTVGGPPLSVTVPTAATVLLLAAQLAAVRPRLSRRSDRVLAGEQLPRSRAHLAYVIVECGKVLALLATGIAVFRA